MYGIYRKDNNTQIKLNRLLKNFLSKIFLREPTKTQWKTIYTVKSTC